MVEYKEISFVLIALLKQKNTSAFTLTELIVVITILAILWTLWFISYWGFTKWARNSARISDMKIIQKAVSVYSTAQAELPLPDNATAISYSGATAWTQGTFWENVILKIGRISNIPYDPTFWTQYTYSLLNNRRTFSIWSVIEDGLFSIAKPLVSESYALAWNGLKTHTIWNYLSYDIAMRTASGCTIITAPSIILSDIPNWGIIENEGYYTYAYWDSKNLPSSYSGSLEFPQISTDSFQMFEILNSCKITNLTQLKLYIAKLATIYQPLANIERFESLVFLSNTKEFQITAANILLEHGIEIDKSVLDEINSPLYFEYFIDTFSDSDWTQLVTSHFTDDEVGQWKQITWNPSDYTIENNTLQKNTATDALVAPVPFPAIWNSNYSLSFEVDDFAGWTISTYLRYTDSDNYYRLDISSSWYVLMRRFQWVDSIFQNINDPISSWSTIVFSVEDDTISFGVDGIEKENVLAGWVIQAGDVVISLENSGS